MAVDHEREFENGTPLIGGRLRARPGDDVSDFENRTPSRLDGKRKWADMGAGGGVWFLAVLALMGGCHGYQEQRFAMEPQDQVSLLYMLRIRQRNFT